MKRMGCGKMVFAGIVGFEHHGFGVELPAYLL